MTDETMALRQMLEKGSEATFLREMIGFAAQRLMELEVGEVTGAAHGERSPNRLVQRNGYRDRAARALGMKGVSKSQVSRLCVEIDERARDFLTRPIEGDWPYLWLDATCVKVREAGRIVPVAVTIAVGVNADGRREVLGMATGASEAETFWLDSLRSLARRGLRAPSGVPSQTSSAPKCPGSPP